MSTCNSGLAGEIIAFTYPSLIKTSDNQVIPRVQGGNRCLLDVFTNENSCTEPNALANLSDGNGNVTSIAIGQQGAGMKVCGPVYIAGAANPSKGLLGVCNGNVVVGCSLFVNDAGGANNICGTTNVQTLNVACALTVTGCSTLNGGLNVAGGTSSFTNLATFNGGVNLAGGNLSIASGNLTVCGTINAQSDITAFSTSDKRLKNNIIKISNSADVINNISGYSFDWNEKSGKEGSTVGVIAQEVKELIPSAVRENSNGYLSVDYIKLIPYLIEEVKSLNNRIKTLEDK